MKRSTLLALVVLIALGSYVYWTKDDPMEDDGAERVFDVSKDDVDRITIHGREEVSLERAEAGWQLTSPVEGRADATEVDILLQNLESMELERRIPIQDGMALDEFGLDEPELTVRFRAQASEYELVFGQDTITPSNQYAKRGEADDVLIVATYLSNNLDKTAWELRDKGIFDVAEDAEAQRVRIERRDETVELFRNGATWTMTSPVAARADRLVVAGLVSDLRDAEMLSLQSESPGKEDALEPFGLDEPSLQVQVDFGEGGPDPIALDVGADTGLDYFARVPSRPQVFVVEASLVDALARDHEAFWSKKLFDYRATDVTRIEVTGPEDTRTVVAKESEGDDETWTMTAPETRSVETELVDDLLYELNASEAEEVTTALPGGAPVYTISITTEPLEEQVRVYVEDDAVRAFREGDEVALRLNPEAWNDIASKLTLQGEQ